MKAKIKIRRAILSLSGIGFIKGAPGTYASAITTAALYFIAPVEWYLTAAACIVISLACYYSAKKEISDESDDPAWIVADEAAGQLLVFATPFLPHDPLWYAAGFLLFRFFDIRKPWPVNMADEKKGSFFVLLDDIIAGFFASVALHLLFWAYFTFAFFAVGNRIIG